MVGLRHTPERKMGKRWLFFLAVITQLWGCSAPSVTQEEELPEIEVQCLSNADEKSKKRIEEAVSEITEEYGFRVSFDLVSLDQLSTEVNIRALDNDLPDVMLINGNTLLVKNIKNQVLAPMDHLSGIYPELRDYMKGIRLEGMEQEVCYSLNGNNESVFRLGFAMRGDICREFGRAEELLRDCGFTYYAVFHKRTPSFRKL